MNNNWRNIPQKNVTVNMPICKLLLRKFEGYFFDNQELAAFGIFVEFSMGNGFAFISKLARSV